VDLDRGFGKPSYRAEVFLIPPEDLTEVSLGKHCLYPVRAIYASPVGQKGDSMSSGKLNVFKREDFLQAMRTTMPTPRQKKILALFQVVEDKLFDELIYDCVSIDFYRPTLEVIVVEANGMVHTNFSCLMSLSPIEELVDDCEDAPGDVPAIFALLKPNLRPSCKRKDAGSNTAQRRPVPPHKPKACPRPTHAKRKG
jgi:hypothetical protein